MSKKQPPAPAAPKAPAFDMTTADFPTLLERFNTSTCDTESYLVATYMMKFPQEALALLPGGAAIRKDIDFNGDDQTNTREWASALLAAKKLKIELGIELPVEKTGELIDKTRDIYKATEPLHKDSKPPAISCQRL